jgi:hypothetical protein
MKTHTCTILADNTQGSHVYREPALAQRQTLVSGQISATNQDQQ